MELVANSFSRHFYVFGELHGEQRSYEANIIIYRSSPPEIGWAQSNRPYIDTRREWRRLEALQARLPENIYDVYMQHWKNVAFTRVR